MLTPLNTLIKLLSLLLVVLPIKLEVITYVDSTIHLNSNTSVSLAACSQKLSVIDTYNFTNPVVAITCQCKCTRRKTNFCGTQATVNNGDIILFNCPDASEQNFCPPFLRSLVICHIRVKKNPKEKIWTAYKLEKYPNTVTYHLHIEMNNQKHKLQISRGNKTIMVDDNLFIEVKEIDPQPDPLGEYKLYYGIADNKNLKTLVPINEKNEWDASKLGWFKQVSNNEFSYDPNEFLKRIVFSGSSCSDMRIQLNLAGYYDSNGFFRGEKTGKLLQDITSNPVDDIKLNLDAGIVSLYYKKPPARKIEFSIPDKKNLIPFRANILIYKYGNGILQLTPKNKSITMLDIEISSIPPEFFTIFIDGRTGYYENMIRVKKDEIGKWVCVTQHENTAQKTCRFITFKPLRLKDRERFDLEKTTTLFHR